MISPKRLARLTFSLALIGLFAAGGCHPNPAQPPSPVGVAVADGSGYLVFYRWKDGPAVLICADVKPDVTQADENASGPPWHRTISGLVGEKEGRQVEWQFETADGKSVKTKINGAEYDLANGGLFLVKTQGGTPQVEQVNADLSKVQAEKESVKAFAAGDAKVSKLLGGGG